MDGKASVSAIFNKASATFDDQARNNFIRGQFSPSR